MHVFHDFVGIGGLRASRNPISVVVSPDGGHLCIITLEDIVEEIVGEVEV